MEHASYLKFKKLVQQVRDLQLAKAVLARIENSNRIGVPCA